MTWPLSLLVTPAVATLGIPYVWLAGARTAWVRTLGRGALLGVTWAAPLMPFVAQGPGVMQLTLGLLVGFLGIRMVALGERWRPRGRPAPSAGRILAAMLTPEELLAPAAPDSHATAARSLARGFLLATACVALLALGNQIRLWQWSRAADDLLIFVEVACGVTASHHLIVGAAALGGWQVAGLLARPLRSASLSEFWTRRWNRLVQGNLDRGFFRPRARRGRFVLGTLMAFGASGVMHVVAVLDTGRPASFGPSVAVMSFFLLHGALVLGERRLGLARPPEAPRALLWARLRTIGLLALTSPLMIEPFAKAVHVHGRALGGP